MARQVRSPIATRSARLKLEARREPYWQQIEPGLSVGYYRPGGGGAGTWWARARADGRYRQAAIGTADDHEDAGPASTVLSWAGAQAAGRAWSAKMAGTAPLTLGQAIEGYLAEHVATHARRAETVAHSPTYFTSIIGRTGRAPGRPALPPTKFAGKLVVDLTTADLAAWLKAEAEKTSKATANRRWSALRAALNHAVRQGRVPRQAAETWRAVVAYRRADGRRESVLDGPQTGHLIAVCRDRIATGQDPEFARMMVVLALTGCRPGEVWNANAGGLDRKTRTLLIDGKTGERRVALGPEAMALVLPLVEGRAPTAPLLPDPKGQAWDRKSVERPIRRLIRAATEAAADRPELAPPSDTTGYTLRHSWITNSLLAGISALAAAKHCGTSLAMIQKNYGHLIDEAAARTAALAESAILPADDRVVPLRRAGGAS